jgi:hypothetical protein
MARTNQENLEFAGRLKQALKRFPKRVETPSELVLQFNLVYQGDPVTNQAAQKWLTGNSRPSPDKIKTLAQMCKVSEQWLRYGIPEIRPSALRLVSVTKVRQEVPPYTQPQPQTQSVLPGEAQLLTRYRTLSEHQRRLVADLVEQLALDWEMWHDPDGPVSK